MLDNERSSLRRHGAAVLAVVVAIVARLLLNPALGEGHVPFITFFLAVAFAAWYGGMEPALLAVVLSTVSSIYFLSPAGAPGLGDRAGWLSLGLFVVVGMAMALMGGGMRAAQQRAEDVARAAGSQREYLRTMLASIGDGVIATDAEGRVVLLNAVAQRLTGWSQKEAEGQPLDRIFRIVNEHTRQPVENPVCKAIREGRPVGLANHTLLLARDGTEWPIDDSAAPIRDERGSIVGVVLIFRDVTERRHAARVRRHLAAIVESSDDAIIGKSLEGVITSWNAGAERLYGYPAGEALGQPFSLLLPPDSSEKVDDVVRRLRHGERLDHFETVRRRKDGSLVSVSVSYSPIKDAEGHLVGTAVITRDITALKRAQESLRSTAERLGLALDAARLGDWSWDAASDLVTLSERAAEIFGIPPGPHMTWTRMQGLLHEEDRERARLRVEQAAAEHGDYDIEYRVCRPDGSQVWVAVLGRAQYSPAGRPLGMFGIIRDITEGKKAEEALREESRATETLYRIGKALAAELDLERIVQTVTDEATALTGARIGAYFHNVQTEQGKAYDLYTISGLPRQAFAGFPTPRSTALFEPTFRGQGVVRLADVTRDPRFGRNAPYHGLPEGHPAVRSYLAVPVVSRSGEVLGGLFFGHPEAGVFSERHERLVVSIAGQAAVAIDDARLYARLRESEGRFRLLTEVIPQLVWSGLPDGGIDYCNPRWLDYTGLTQEQVRGDGWAAALHPDDLAPTLAAWRQATTTGRPYQVEQRLRSREGVYRWFLTRALPLRDEGGKVHRWYGTCTDIDDEKRSREVLAASEAHLRLALEAGRMGTWSWSCLTNEVSWSPGLEAIHGLAPGSFPGTFEAYQRDIHPDDRERVLGSIRRSLEEGREHHLEYRLIWPDGSVRWVEARGKPLRDDGDRPARMVGVCMDISQRKKVEQDTRFLADASATLAALVDYESTLQKVARLAVPFFASWCSVDMLDEGGRLCRVAVAHADPEKVELARELHRRFPPDPAAPQGVWQILRTGRSELVPEIDDELLVAQVKDPELLRIMRALGLKSYMGVPLSIRGRVLGVITFIAAESGRRYGPADLDLAEDLAHRAAVAIDNARLYQEVREADRRKEDFLSLLAHELRNPLAPIRNGLQILKLARGDGQAVGPTVEMMERQLQHLVRLVDDLLDVSRIVRNRIELRREPVELATVVARGVETSQPLIEAAGHELSVDVPAEPLWVNGDVVRLAQVVSNLLNNAARYTERGGRIWVSAGREGDTGVLRVRDTGVGIAPEMLSRIWDMFVQADRNTKSSQGGMGVGLTLVRSLVELHGGRVEAYSAGPGQGSELVVKLPLMPRPDADVCPLPGGGTRDGTRNVLVVDDNVDAADSLAILLRLGGHRVRVAHDGPTALRLAEADPPEVAFLDIGMPGMDGYELARRFRNNPALENVFLVALTGWGQEEDRQRTRRAGFDAHEVKPVEPDVLSRLLQGRPEHRGSTP